VRAVMDAVGSERAFLWTAQDGGRLAVLFAATYPERTAGLLLFDPAARGRRGPDYPWAPSDDEWRRRLAEVREGWGERAFLESLLAEWEPTKVGDDEFRAWFVSHMRRSLSPGSAVAFFRMMMDADVTDVLPSVRVPTLVLALPVRRGQAEHFAGSIPGAELVELPPFEGMFSWADDRAHEAAMRETKRFVSRHGHPEEPDRVLVTVVFTDIVGSTERAADLGDSGWRNLLERHHALVRAQLARFRGREIDTAGDGFFASFDGPARAVRCATAIRDEVRALGLEIRAGVHTGECEVAAGKIVGQAVNTGARVAALAQPGEVLATSTVRDLVAGAGLAFEDRGEHELKGIAEPKRLFAVID
ncbi:MAG: hypothetical protein AUI83_22720, partial [Armatimonadetes bacterium 13_1_40CM_3_65_7]